MHWMPIDSRKEKFVRVALVQIDYQPSICSNVSYIEEPCLLDEGDIGVTSIHISLPGFEDRAASLRHEIRESQESFVRRRLELILPRLDSLKADIVVFPEFSIPASCLQLIDSLAGDCIVVAGSHTVTTASRESYSGIGLSVSPSDINKSISPIRLATYDWVRIDKLTPSQWETHMKKGTHWEPISTTIRSGQDLRFGIFLCIDFINEADPHLQSLIPRDIWTNLDLVLVPSLSPTVRDFKYKARPLAERTKRPVVYVNSASMGGSQFFWHFREVTSLCNASGTVPLEAGEEIALVADILVDDSDEARHTAIPARPSSSVVAALPLIPESKLADLHSLRQQIKSATLEEDKRHIILEHRDQLLRLLNNSALRGVANKKVADLYSGASWKDGGWLEFCLDCIVTSSDDTLAETSFSLLHKTQALLADVIRDHRLEGSDLLVVTKALNIYRGHLDILRPSISTVSKEKFESTDLSVHTVARNESDADYTSLFMMRLTGSRVVRTALERQIDLISTLAYKGNSNLALNLRYVSEPNPGGNLKDLQVLIIGAARNSDRIASRELADQFRRDLANLLRVTLRDSYLFELEEIGLAELMQKARPSPVNHIVEIQRTVEFGTQPYINLASSPRIAHLQGNSLLDRVVDMLQASPFSCSISVHLQPVVLSHPEDAFFDAVRRGSEAPKEDVEGSMFYLGTERNPTLQMSNAVVMRRLLGESAGIRPNLLVRFFIYSDQPLSNLLVTTIGSELWGNDTYHLEEVRVWVRGIWCYRSYAE